jgi:membrane AbrB-like protein
MAILAGLPSLRATIGETDKMGLTITLMIGAIGGALAHQAHFPLGYLLGSLIAVGTLAALQISPFGHSIALPARLRFSFVPVIGVAIGGAFTPEVAHAALGWWPSLLALCVFVPLAHSLGYFIYRTGGLAPADAFFGAVPGGLIESVQLGEEAGADVRLLTVLQFLRLILTIVTVPILFWALTGHSVGSAAGIQMVGADQSLSASDVVLMILAGALGATVAKRVKLPGYIITGPIVFSAALHLGGYLQGIPPHWLIATTQVVLGAGLGARFVGITPALLKRGARLALVNGAASLVLAFVFAEALHWTASEPVSAAFLAFAPGGLAEMSLIALSLQISVIYVTTHHVFRIFIAVGLAQMGRRWIRPR